MIKIPKTVHIIWIGPKPYPFGDYKDSWLLHNPDWELKYWHNDNLPEIHNRKLFDLMPSWAGKTDILRYELLYKYGGLYSDADAYCLRPVEPLIDGLECFSMTSNSGKRVCIAVLATIPAHPAFEKIVYGLEAHFEKIKELQKKEQRTFNLHWITGSFYISPILMADPNFVRIDNGKKEGTRKYFCSLRDSHEDAYIVQCHRQSWRRDQVGKLTKGLIQI